jgi:hypothetical protein
MKASVMGTLLWLGAVACGACGAGPEVTPVNNVVWDAKNVKAYGETAAGLPPETAFGWDLVVAGGVAKWRECASLEECGNVARSRPAKDVVGVERVGKTSTPEGEVEVLKLSLAPRPSYVVPYTKPGQR